MFKKDVKVRYGKENNSRFPSQDVLCEEKKRRELGGRLDQYFFDSAVFSGTPFIKVVRQEAARHGIDIRYYFLCFCRGDCCECTLTGISCISS